jgi:hypothetical protein
MFTIAGLMLRSHCLISFLFGSEEIAIFEVLVAVLLKIEVF